MNFQQKILTAATATFVGLASTVVPAQAFSFGNGGITFDKDTTLEFNYLRSGGWYMSKMGIVEVGANNKLGSKTYLFEEATRADKGSGDNNDWYATNNLLGSNKTTFTFEKGKTYALFLDSLGAYRASKGAYDVAPTVYSTTAMNDTKKGFGQQVKFFDTGNVSQGDLDATGADRKQTAFATKTGDDLKSLQKTAIIGFEDLAKSGDKDYNDFVVSATEVPEPATLGALALVGGAVAQYRRRRTTAKVS